MTKYKTMFLMIVCTMLCISAVTLSPAKAQFLDNRLSVYAAFSSGTFPGDHWAESGGLVTPSLFANYSGNTGISTSLSYDLTEWFAATLHASAHTAGKWDHPESELYHKAGLQYYYVAPGLRLQSPYRQLGFLNRGRLFAGFSYGGGQMTLDLLKPVMTILWGQRRPSSPDGETTFYHGWKASAGFQYTINPSFGFYAGYSLHSNRIDGLFFTDTGFKASILEVGVFLRFMDKRRHYL